MNNHSWMIKKMSNLIQPFILSDKSVQADQSTRLVQWFSHKQSKVDFQRCAEILHRSDAYIF